MSDNVILNANTEFAYSNVSLLNTNFKQEPYYDDFDERDNYYKTLFKPGKAVQSRELIEIQSTLQNQIQRFGQHMFNEGSMVLGGLFHIDTRAHYVKVKDLDSNENPVSISNFENQIVTGQTTGIQALVNITIDGDEASGNTKTLYVSYLSGNADTGDVYFTPNEILVANVGTLVVSNTTPAVGYGSTFTLNEGVRFCKGYFVYNPKQSIVLDRYDIFPTCRVGFILNESIVNNQVDPSLIDPALESTNYGAPGADRFKITATLTKLEIDDLTGTPDYVNLFEINRGTLTTINERPEYDVIGDEIAKRTYDESGNYYVKGFNVVLEEHLDIGNGGYLPLDRGGDYNKLSVQVEPGTCYVRGYEVNKLVTQFITTDKSTTFSNVASQSIIPSLGSYVIVNEAVGSWNLNTGQVINLYDTAQKRISSGASSIPAPTGKLIGSSKIASVTINSGYAGTPNGTLRVNLLDVSMNGSNSFSNVRSLYYNNATNADIGADIVLRSNSAALYADSPMLYYIGSPHTRSLRGSDGSVNTSFQFSKTSDVTLSSNGYFQITTSGDEIFPYGVSTLSDTQKSDILVSLNANVTIGIGTILSGNGTTTLNGNATNFTRLNVGDRIRVTDNNTSYTVQSIANNTTLVVDKVLPAVSIGNTISKVFLSGDMIDLRTLGVDAGDSRVVTSSNTTLSISLMETTGAISATVTYPLLKTGAREIKKYIKSSRYVTINCGTHPALRNGPYSLGFSDVIGIRSIRKSTSVFSTLTQGTDVTSSFTFDNGQRDDCYKNATITPTSNITLTASDKLLVCFDYFTPDYNSGSGYFSIDSYPVNDINPSVNEINILGVPFYKSTTTGFGYNLRNYLDFRPVYTNSATDTTSLTGITTNPVSSTTLQYDNTNIRILIDRKPITFDYSQYMARRDVVAIDNRGKFKVIQGVPSPYPITPVCPQQYMSLAKLYIAPYPSLSPNFAKLLGRNDLACSVGRTSQVRFTMKDIGVLKQRVDNAENYVSLSLLEKSVSDLKILDANGLDRFKNGMFVDSFTSFGSSDIGNPDHHICYDPKEGSIRPIFETEAIGYKLYSNTNTIQMDSILMLPYTEVVAVKQPYATTYKNVEMNVYRFIGKLYLSPDSDYWVNTQRLASQTYEFGTTDTDVTPYSIVYGSWQTVVTGVTTTDPILVSSNLSSTVQSSGTGNPNVVKYTGMEIWNDIKSLVSTYGADTIITLDAYDWVANGYSTSNKVGKFSLSLGDLDKGGDKRYYDDRFGWYGTVYSAAYDQYFYFDNLGNFAWTGDGIDPVLKARNGVPPTNPSFKAIEWGNIVEVDGTTGEEYTKAGILQVSNTDIITVTLSNTSSSSIYSTTTSSQATRTFTETFQSIQSESQSIGDKVTTVAPIADIRPQTIAFEGFGLKSNTKHYVYFDGQLMSKYVTPGRDNPPLNPTNNTFGNTIVPIGSEGTSLYSDSSGAIYGFLRIPTDTSKTFRTGTKEIVITDSPTNQADSTSAAKTYFAAQGINQTVQNDIISTNQVVKTINTRIEKQPIVYSNTYTTTGNAVGSMTISYTDFYSCMAYSFKLNTPLGEEGTFLSSVDVFFAAKDPNLGLWFEVRAMDNAGNITKTQIPGSEVFIPSSQVNISSDASLATNVKFNSPIFLTNNQEYAFVIHTVGINPNYYVYTCVLGETDIVTKQQVNDRPLTGTLYITNNNTDWNPINRTDLKVTFNRAKFDTSVIGEVILGNESREYIQLPLDIQTASNASWFGERVTSNNATGTNRSITFKSSADKTMFNANSIIMTIENSNGLFTPSMNIVGNLSSSSVVPMSITKFIYDTIQFEPSYISFIKTDVKFEMSTTSNVGIVDVYKTIPLSTPIDYDIPMAIYSRSDEINYFNSNPSNKVKINLSSSSDYLSPIINLNRTYSVYIHNIINSNTSNEYATSGGMLKNKYISQVVTLAEGQDAEDLKILLTSYLPPSSNAGIKVYVRISNAEDFESIYSRNWSEMIPTGIVYSSLSNRKDWREIQYGFPTSRMIGENDQGTPIVGYTNSVGTTFQGFRQYQIKIGLLSDSSAIYPRVADLRSIALQV